MNTDVRLLLPVFLVAITFIAPATAYVPDTLTVTFLDVGEADAIMVQAPNGQTMLVDAGRKGNTVTVSDALAAEGIERLDHVFGTHEDADHIGGMAIVLSYMEMGEHVNNSVGSDAPSDTTLFLRTYLAGRGITPRAVTTGDTLALDPDNVSVTVLNPPAVPARTRTTPRSSSGSSSATMGTGFPDSRTRRRSDTLITFSRLHQAEGEP